MPFEKTLLGWDVLTAPYLGVGPLQAYGEALEYGVKWEREEEHEGAEGGVGLEVHMHVGTTGLQVLAKGVPVPVPSIRHEGSPLLMVTMDMLAVKYNSLQNEDQEEAWGYDKFREGEANLFEQKCLNRMLKFNKREKTG